MGASVSRLNRPLIRFYCNDCKKKFRSRILANRNNNAVQHYCSLYQKIITRKVESHSNKCKGDHGMGPCVVKRTDIDPDSDGEDETKAAYYADKGKKRPMKKKKSPTKKRKRADDANDGELENHKRQRLDDRDMNMNGQSYYYPPQDDGYYHANGYMAPMNGHHGNGYHHQYQYQYGYQQAVPPMHDVNEEDCPPPPPIND